MPASLHWPPFTGTRPRHLLAVEAHAQSFGTQWGLKNRVEPGCKIVAARSISKLGSMLSLWASLQPRKPSAGERGEYNPRLVAFPRVQL
jgi:hypothetical protein